jgi:ABC-type transport system involved in multi-copper enzyme maturation permease subunit
VGLVHTFGTVYDYYRRRRKPVMTLKAILVKEMRLRMRRERTIWTLVLYVLLLGLLGWFSLNNSFASMPTINQWSRVGYNLYHLLTAVQILLILFITPAFTATAINSEKERQTYEMLVCSRISSLSLVGGKLLAGLSTSFLLIIASIPLFSLIFLLGGITLASIFEDLQTFVITAVLVATLGFLCSALFRRQVISIAITYTFILLWLATPILLQYISLTTHNSTGVVMPGYYMKSGFFVGGSIGPINTPPPPLITAWHPFVALNDTSALPFVPSPIPYTASYVGTAVFTVDGISSNVVWSPDGTILQAGSPLNGFNLPQQASPNYVIAGLSLTPQMTYAILSGIAIVIFFVLSLCFAKPNTISRMRTRLKRKNTVSRPQQKISYTIKDISDTQLYQQAVHERG